MMLGLSRRMRPWRTICGAVSLAALLPTLAHVAHFIGPLHASSRGPSVRSDVADPAAPTPTPESQCRICQLIRTLTGIERVTPFTPPAETPGPTVHLDDLSRVIEPISTLYVPRGPPFTFLSH